MNGTQKLMGRIVRPSERETVELEYAGNTARLALSCVYFNEDLAPLELIQHNMKVQVSCQGTKIDRADIVLEGLAEERAGKIINIHEGLIGIELGGQLHYSPRQVLSDTQLKDPVNCIVKVIVCEGFIVRASIVQSETEVAAGKQYEIEGAVAPPDTPFRGIVAHLISELQWCYSQLPGSLERREKTDQLLLSHPTFSHYILCQRCSSSVSLLTLCASNCKSCLTCFLGYNMQKALCNCNGELDPEFVRDSRTKVSANCDQCRGRTLASEALLLECGCFLCLNCTQGVPLGSCPYCSHSLSQASHSLNYFLF